MLAGPPSHHQNRNSIRQYLSSTLSWKTKPKQTLWV